MAESAPLPPGRQKKKSMTEREKKLLIVDDEKHTRDGLRASFEEHYEVYVAGDIEGAMAIMETEMPDVLLTDLRLGQEDGMDLTVRALKLPHPPICIIMTAYGSVDTAVEAMKAGAYDFVTKPINLDRLELLVRRALRERATQKENVELKRKVENRFRMESLLGSSGIMEEVFQTIRQVAPSRATVLIQGESGTGKELAAHAIHTLSPRANHRFVAVHCAALPGTLLESELFGHEKGAFTGATERRMGRFEQAAKGTLFLDEIGEIDQTTQVKILRVLGEREFERIGGTQTLQADVRIVAATNKDLRQLVAEGKFREDLFFRLNVVQITMPPLRDRKEDIPLLAQSFLKVSAEENGKPFRELTPEALEAMIHYQWPGNVRELRAAIEHGVVMSSSSQIGLRNLPEALRAGNKGNPLKGESVREAPPDTGLNLQETERSLILRALDASGGNRTAAAKKLGMSRRTLHRRLQEFQNLSNLDNKMASD